MVAEVGPGLLAPVLSDPVRTIRLVDRTPDLGAVELVTALAPPPLFAKAGFDTYLPDPNQPTQAAAVAALKAFAARTTAPAPARRKWRRAPAPPEARAGIYLDGGFGVGKTHLLAALWHSCPDPKIFGTFVELTNLVGAVGFADVVEQLARHRLVCIDEFELDDPGDTVLMSTLLQRLTEAGVMLAATSNTLPDRLGEDRFAAADFLREIQGLAGHFDVVRIEGQDYRHRGTPAAPPPATESAAEAEVRRATQAGELAAVDDFDALLLHLATLHPSRYGALVDDVDVAVWRDVGVLADQAVALRLVVLVDRLYDRGVRLVASGTPLNEIFSTQMLAGGYRKKYYRALSRLVAIAGSDR